MTGNRSVWQLLLGAASLLLLVAAGYVTVSGLSSLDDINQGLTTLTENLGSALQGASGAEPEEPEVSPPAKVEEPEVSPPAEVEEPAGDAAPTISSHTPGTGASDVALDATINISFSEEVALTEGWFDITCDSSGTHPASASGGPQSYVLDPEADFSNGETCTVKVLATKVADTGDPPNSMASDYEFSFATVAAAAVEKRPESAASESIEVLLPTSDEMLLLSKKHPEIQIRLENVISATESVTLTNVQVQLLVPKRKLGTDQVEPSDSTYVATATQAGYTIAVGSGVNVTLHFDGDNLPPTGEYKAWLMVTSDNGKPRTKELTLDVVSDPEDKPGDESLAFVHSSRLFLSNAGEESRSVRIGLKSLKKADTLTVGGVELLILKEKQAGGNAKVLTPGIAATTDMSEGLPLEIEPGEVRYVTFTFDRLPTSGTYEAWLLATPEQDKPISKAVDIDVTSLLPEDSQSSVKARLPSGTGTSLVLSHHAPEVQIRLENLEDCTITADIQLIVAQKISGTNTTPLSPGYSSQTATRTISPTQAMNVNLSFGEGESRIPPSGDYEAWLLVTGDKGKLLAETYTMTVSAEPLDRLRHRLTDKTGNDKAITIGGIRRCPEALDWLLSKRLLNWLNWCRKGDTVSGINWDGYELALWEEHLRVNPGFAVVGSELANSMDGRSGWLEVTLVPTGVTTGTILPTDVTPLREYEGSKVALVPIGVTAPGEYKGNVTLVAPNGEQKVETIDVTVRLRDALWQPFVVIVVGALVLGWLLRHALGDTSQNVSFQMYRIEAMRARLRRTGVCTSSPINPACLQIEYHLRHAEVALAAHDFGEAETALAKADRNLQKLETVKARLEAAERESESEPAVRKARRHFDEGDLESAEKALGEVLFRESDEPTIEVKHLGRKDFYEPTEEPVELFTGEKIYFKSRNIQGPWSKQRKLLGIPIPPRADRLTSDTVQFTFKRAGSYQLKRGEKTLQLKAIRNPVQVAARRVELNANLANVIWAGVAGVAGLLYIEASLPTFGSPMHYLAALAWGLGVSTASLPAEGFAAKLREYWVKLGKPKVKALPSAESLKGKTGAQVEIALKGLGFTNIDLEPPGIDKATAEYDSMHPDAGSTQKLDAKITVTLKPRDGKGGGEQPGTKALPQEGVLQGKTGAQVETALKGLGFTNIDFGPEGVDKAEAIYDGMHPDAGSTQTLDVEITVTLKPRDEQGRGDELVDGSPGH
jgi:hypothetical protein